MKLKTIFLSIVLILGFYSCDNAPEVIEEKKEQIKENYNVELEKRKGYKNIRLYEDIIQFKGKIIDSAIISNEQIISKRKNQKIKITRIKHYELDISDRFNIDSIGPSEIQSIVLTTIDDIINKIQINCTYNNSLVEDIIFVYGQQYDTVYDYTIEKKELYETVEKGEGQLSYNHLDTLLFQLLKWESESITLLVNNRGIVKIRYNFSTSNGRPSIHHQILPDNVDIRDRHKYSTIDTIVEYFYLVFQAPDIDSLIWQIKNEEENRINKLEQDNTTKNF